MIPGVIGWPQVGGGTGTVLLADQAFTAEASIALDGIIDATCNAWDIAVAIESAGAAMIPHLRLRSAGADVASSSYRWAGLAKSIGGGVVGYESGYTTSLPIAYATLSAHTAQVRLIRRSATSFGFDIAAFGADTIWVTGGGEITANGDGLVLYPSASTITGRITVTGRLAA